MNSKVAKKQGIPRTGSSSQAWTPKQLFWAAVLVAAILGALMVETVPDSKAHQTLYQHVPANKFQQKKHFQQ